MSERDSRPTRTHRTPRFLGTTRFARLAGEDPADISRWRLRNSLIWIPQPDVVLGGRKIPGWDIRIAVAWTRTAAPYTRPEPEPYLDTPQVLRRLRLATYPTLWNLIAAGQVRPPDIWLDNHPGWDEQRGLHVRIEAA